MQVDPQTERTIHRNMQTRTGERPATREERTVEPITALKCDRKEQNWEMVWQERRITSLAKGADATPAVRSDYLRSKRHHIGTKREVMMI